MSKLSTAVARMPLVGPVVLIAYRTKTALEYFQEPLCNVFKWLAKSKETGNFTYELENTNKRYLASMIADIFNMHFTEVMNFFREIEKDTELKRHVAITTARSDWAFVADEDVRLARRIGWYAIARTIKPKVIIESGVDKGLGSCVLAAALMRNTREGHPGYYYGLDINPKAGYLLCGEYARYGSIVYGDAIEAMKNFSGIVDLYINDSDHSADYEAREYRTIANKLSERGIVLGDNAHASNKLLEFSLAEDRHFVFFQEKPREHWYPGAGIGISFRRDSMSA